MFLKPSLYVRSIARLSFQSGPIIVTAQTIFVYRTPRAQSCHSQRTGVCSRGTLNGMTTTSSRSRPDNRGMTPISKKTAIIALPAITHLKNETLVSNLVHFQLNKFIKRFEQVI